MKLSIIVPIYNVAPYLRKCVDSLLAQDISNYEIILVDDGSPDECPQICDEYAATHSRIHVIHQENAGLSAARNAGIAVAQGEYIWFVDSDDYVEPNVLGALMEQIERDNLDVLRFRYQNVRESGESFAPYKDMTNYNDYSTIPTDGLTFLNDRMGYQCYVVQFVAKRNIVIDELFMTGIYFEDTDWTPRMLLKAKRVASTDRIVYNYLWREGSITLTCNKEKLQKHLHDKLIIIERLQNLSYNIVNDQWFKSMVTTLILSVVNIVASYFYTERKIYISKIKRSNVLPLSKEKIAFRAHRKVNLINISIELAILFLFLNTYRKKI